MGRPQATKEPIKIEGASGKLEEAKQEQKMWGPVSGIFIGLLIFIGSQIITAIIIAILAGGNGQSLSEYYDENTILVSFIGGALLGSLTIALIYGITRPYGGWKALKIDNFSTSNIGWALPAFVLYFLISAALFTVVSLWLPEVDLDQDQVIGFESAASAVQMVMAFVALVVIAPISEELLFRGYTFQGIRTKFHWVVAALISSLLFALAHMQLNVGIDTFALGFVACLLLEKTGSLWPAILLHSIKNGIAYYVLFIA